MFCLGQNVDSVCGRMSSADPPATGHGLITGSSSHGHLYYCSHSLLPIRRCILYFLEMSFVDMCIFTGMA
jgi:hypothetical protein